MGVLNIKQPASKKDEQIFMKSLLTDVKVLDEMLAQGLFNDKVTRIGAEQELCLIDSDFRASTNNLQILEAAKHPMLTSELAKFTLEFNAEPKIFEGTCFSDLENELLGYISEVRQVARKFGSELILTGIIPTIRKFDLDEKNLTPIKRYEALCNAIDSIRGKIYELKIAGVEDEIRIMHDTPVLEACNTGYQIHLQVKPEDFVRYYNIAQMITAPVLAAGTNSPILLGKRLWRETRIALFQETVDTRQSSHHLREQSARVTFGNSWLENITDIYKEDIVKYRVLLSNSESEDPWKVLNGGGIPKLHALGVHNSTVYRWNRPCFGVTEGIPHMRIENRALPSGPSVADEMANSALWLGLMNAFGKKGDDVAQMTDFDVAKSNFFSAARHGLDTKLTWLDGQSITPTKLILDKLLPMAEEGLAMVKVNKKDSDRYLKIIEERVKSRQTGSSWILNSRKKLVKNASLGNSMTSVMSAMLKHQLDNRPVHEWPIAKLEDGIFNFDPSNLLVEEFMDKELFTVRETDILALVSDMVDWQKIRYVPVEDNDGKLIGMVTSRLLLRHYSQKLNYGKDLAKSVSDIMIKNPISIRPDSTIKDTIDLMQKNNIGCLPVVDNGSLVGIITEENFMNITNLLLGKI